MKGGNVSIDPYCHPSGHAPIIGDSPYDIAIPNIVKVI